MTQPSSSLQFRTRFRHNDSDVHVLAMVRAIPHAYLYIFLTMSRVHNASMLRLRCR